MVKGSQAKHQPPRSIGIALIVLGAVVALGRLPLIRSPIDVSPDGCEYLGIARHLVTEGQWLSSLKWHFFTDGPVLHPALADRPPLYPLWAAGWVALTADPAGQIWLARFGNLLLAAVLPAIIYWAVRVAVVEAAAALTALVLTFYPAFWRYSAQPLTEPLFLLLLFSSLGLFLRGGSPRRWVTCGALAGLALLTRPSGILLPAVYSAALLVRAAARPSVDSSRWMALRLVLAGFLVLLFPYWMAVAAQTGSPFTSILRYNYSIRQIDEGTLNGFERSFPPPLQFVLGYAAEVTRLVAHQWHTMGIALARSLQFLLPLALFGWRGRNWERGVLAGLVVLNFLFHAMAWTVWGAARYMLPSYILGIALLLDAPLRWAGRASGEGASDLVRSDGGRTRLACVVVGLAVGLTLITCWDQDVRLVREKAQPYAGVELGWAYAVAGARLVETPPGSICAANQPWIVNLLARRPAVIAPRFRDPGQLRRFLRKFRPATLTLFVTERVLADIQVADLLVEDLWTRPRLKPELADTLVLETAEHRQTGEAGGTEVVARPPREALLIFRVRSKPAGSGSGQMK